MRTWKAGEMAPGRGPIERIDAVTLVTVDMGEAVAFYLALGFEIAYGGTEAEFTSLRAGDGYLNLQLDRGAARPVQPWGRVILFVDDVDGLHHRCIEAGLAPSTAPADAPWGERYFHLRDPDGHELSFARPLPTRGR